MQTRSSSASSFTTAPKAPLTLDEINFFTQKIAEKDKQLKEQSEALQAREDNFKVITTRNRAEERYEYG